MRGRGGPAAADLGSAVVRGFAVRADVQAFALFLFGDAQADHQVDDLVGDEGDHAGPDQVVSTPWNWIQTWSAIE